MVSLMDNNITFLEVNKRTKVHAIQFRLYVLEPIYNTTEKRNIKANYLVQIKLININEERKKASGDARNFIMNI